MSRVQVLLSSRSALLVGLLLCAGPGAAAGAQAPALSSASADDLQNAAAVLRERHRETLHPGQPLRIVGLEQGDNDFRARTPALARSDRAATQVDPDEQYERRLAAYTDGRAFHRKLPASPAAPTPHLGLPGTRVQGGPAAEAPADQSFTTRYLGPAALLFMLLAGSLLALRYLRPGPRLATPRR